MSPKRIYVTFRRLRTIFKLATVAAALGQVTAEAQVTQTPLTASSDGAQVSQTQTTLDTFEQGQQALVQSFSALLVLNPTPQQMQAWQQENAPQLQAQQQLALNLAADSVLQPLPIIAQPNIPANASTTLAAFLTTQATLANARAQIHNQLLNALPFGEISDAQISQMQQSEVQLFQRQQATSLQIQTQRAQTLAAESALQPLPVPPPLSIPSGSTPQMQAFLTLRDQLMREEITLRNQYVTSTVAARDAALLQWHQQNAARFQQLQQLAQNLAATNSAPQN